VRNRNLFYEQGHTEPRSSSCFGQNLLSIYCDTCVSNSQFYWALRGRGRDLAFVAADVGPSLNAMSALPLPSILANNPARAYEELADVGPAPRVSAGAGRSHEILDAVAGNRSASAGWAPRRRRMMPVVVSQAAGYRPTRFACCLARRESWLGNDVGRRRLPPSFLRCVRVQRPLVRPLLVGSFALIVGHRPYASIVTQLSVRLSPPPKAEAKKKQTQIDCSNQTKTTESCPICEWCTASWCYALRDPAYVSSFLRPGRGYKCPNGSDPSPLSVGRRQPPEPYHLKWMDFPRS